MTFWNRTGALLCALALSVVLAPTVQADEGPFYVSVSGMWVIPGDSDVTETGSGLTAGLTAKYNLEFDDNFGFAAAFGYGELTGFRGELEVSYRSLDLDKTSNLSLSDGTTTVLFTDISTDVLDVEVDTWSAMVNGIYAFDAMGFLPYVGAGIGLAQHDVNSTSMIVADLNADGTNEIYRGGISDDDIVFAWQLMVGVGYAVSDSTEVRLGYRYFDTADVKFDGVEGSYDTHNVELGIVHCF